MGIVHLKKKKKRLNMKSYLKKMVSMGIVRLNKTQQNMKKYLKKSDQYGNCSFQQNMVEYEKEDKEK